MIPRLGLFLGLGLLTIACSEAWFYPIDLNLGLWEVWLVYGIASYLMVAMMKKYRAGWAGTVVAAGLFGFLIEGVVVPVLYEAPPFSILWTSLAWHALLTIGLGVFGFRAIAQRGLVALPVFVVTGFVLGTWQAYMWAAAPGVSFIDYVLQILLAYAFFVVGHLMVDQAVRRDWQVTHWDLWPLWGLMFFVWGISWALPLFPVSLIFPLLVALGWWVMSRDSGASPVSLGGPVPVMGYLLSLVLPVTMYGGFIATLGVIPEMNAWWIMATGPVAIILWFWGHGRLILRRR